MRDLRWHAAILALLALVSTACSSRSSSIGDARQHSPDVETTSLLGQPLSPGIPVAPAVAAADSALAAAPDDPERLLAAASARAASWRFREAVALYTRGMERWPQDWRFPRFRGHRYITLRKFPEAARDLDLAGRLDSTNFDVAYHQGLAHFLLGHHDRAAQVYGNCLAKAGNEALRAREAAGAYGAGYRSCMRNATDADSRVAMSDWAWRALMHAGRRGDADALLAGIGEGLAVSTNRSYYENLLLYKGLRTPEQVMTAAGSDSVRFSTSGYAVANWYLLRGDTARARDMFRRVARSPHWSGFGVIGAEVELVRRKWQ